MPLNVQREPAIKNSTAQLARRLEENRYGKAVGIYSVCSANRFVLQASMLQAREDRSVLLIESTSNQVNQFGGYTGQTPTDFISFVQGIAAEMKFPWEQIVIGGDHLGPHVWRREQASAAMHKACELVRACVLSGYTKIHLDASMRLAADWGEPSSPLSDEVISERAADLCQAAETAYNELQTGAPAPVYVIGTEVPVPGGELANGEAPATTRPEDASRSIELAKLAFQRRGLEAAWERVIALVVQPGVEFGDAVVFPYVPEKAQALAQFVETAWHGVYEAHSTDYQSGTALRQMVRDHFAILKVGPWLTFAFREAVFALAAIEEEWLGGRKGIVTSRVKEALEQAMLANPEYWKSYYHGDDAELRLARRYSLSDRCRYYWPQPEVAEALERLLANLRTHSVPHALLSQFLHDQLEKVQAGAIANDPVALIHEKIRDVLRQYAYASGMRAGPV